MLPKSSKLLHFALALQMVAAPALADVTFDEGPLLTPVELKQTDAVLSADPSLDAFEFGDVKLFFPNQSNNPEVRARIAQLPADRTARAQAVRRWLVQRTGNILFKFRKPIGVYQSVKGRLKQLLPNKEKLRAWFGRNPQPTPEQAALEDAAAKAELSKEKVAGVLAAINSFMFESSAVMATAEEEGIFFSIGLQGEVGGGKLGRGGAISLDVFIGYNRKAETVVISLLPRVESFRNGVSASFGAPIKVEYYWATESAHQAGGRIDGTSVYPPGLPWGSTVNELSEGGFAAIGLFGLIGADFSGGALPLINRSKGVRALRISIPIRRSGFAQRLVEFGLNKFLETIIPDLKTIYSATDDRAVSCSTLLQGNESSGLK